VSIAVRSSRRSASQCWRAWLQTASRRAEICDMLTTDRTPGSCGRLRERDRAVEEARGDRVAEVSPAHSSQGGAHVVEVEQVTHHDFGPRGSELPRTVVLPVHESTYPMPSLQKQLHGGFPVIPVAPVIRKRRSLLFIMLVDLLANPAYRTWPSDSFRWRRPVDEVACLAGGQAAGPRERRLAHRRSASPVSVTTPLLRAGRRVVVDGR
jgi:hypothetical protein